MILPTTKETFDNLDEAARFIGVSRPTFTNSVLPLIAHRKVGRRYLISRRALILWLEGAESTGAAK